MNSPAYGARFTPKLPQPSLSGGQRLETLLAIFVVLWLAAGTFLQDYLFRHVPGTVSAFGALLLVSGLALIRSRLSLRIDGPFPALYVFLMAAAFALVLSFMDYPAVTELPREERFILRQAYFLVILPAAIMTGLALWRGLYTRLYEFCARHFLLLATLFAVADLGTAYYLGNPLFRSFNGYSQFADKLVGSFIFSFIYMARVSHPGYRSILLPLTVLATYFGATELLTYGSLFQASTGILLFLVLATATLLRRRALLAGLILLGGLAALFLLTVVGTIRPELFEADFNSYWRFANWQSNFATLHQTGYLGIGFGTPYFSLQTQDFQHALTIFNRGADPWTSSADPYDLVFLRAQHNSFVNMFFRTGLVGGLAFALFNIAMLARLIWAMTHGSPMLRPHLLLALVILTIAIVQASLHVGIETPGFLIAYGILAGLVIELAWPLRTAVPAHPSARPR